jgi:hypothetical protein
LIETLLNLKEGGHNERLTDCQNDENTTGQPIEIIGGRTRTRTLDPLIKSQLLYQLSYAPEPIAP